MAQLPGRVQRFSAEETDLLVHAVKVREQVIYGVDGNPPKIPEVKQAWEEVAASVSLCSGVTRTVAQCKKRYNDVRRQRKQKLVEKRKHGPGGGPPVKAERLVTAGDVAASTVTNSIQGFGGIEVGIPDPSAGCSQSAPIKQEQGAAEEDERTPEPLPPPGSEASRPRTRRGNVRQEDHPFLETQQAGFNMLEGELGGLRRGVRQLNTRLGRIQMMLRPLGDIAVGLGRLAEAVELLASAATPPTNARPPVL